MVSTHHDVVPSKKLRASLGSSVGGRVRKAGSKVGVFGLSWMGVAITVCGKIVPKVASSSCSSSVIVAHSPESSNNTQFNGYYPRSAISFLLEKNRTNNQDHA